MGLNVMKCSNCHNKSTKVLDSRPIEEGRSIRRRRECEKCGFRFTTFERVEALPLIVIKKAGTRQEYSREKLMRGLIIAYEKRTVPQEKIEEIAIKVEKEIHNIGVAEIDSYHICDDFMEVLVEVDVVAFLRVASVSRQV